MSWTCTIEQEYGSEADARAVLGAIAPDDAGFVRSRVEGTRLVAVMEADAPMKLLHTVEDYLACLGVAERAVEAAKT